MKMSLKNASIELELAFCEPNNCSDWIIYFNSNRDLFSNWTSTISELEFRQIREKILRWNKSIATNISDRSVNPNGLELEVIIPLYVIIFILSVVGNLLIILTLAQNRSMRTVTNVFLLNLAVADLLLGVFCMPFTLVGQLLREFIFGSFMCTIISYFQAVSVSVGVWTLVAISLERYFAICRPLKSRKWQTRSHAYKMIVAIWIFSLVCCLPIAVINRLKPIRNGRHKCREEWPNVSSERAYNLFLDIILLIIPLFAMACAYWRIAARLRRGTRFDISSTNSLNPTTAANLQLPVVPPTSERDNRLQRNRHSSAEVVATQWSESNHRRLCCQPHNSITIQINNRPSRVHGRSPRRSEILMMDHPPSAANEIRSTYNNNKSALAKKKVIVMLFVIVLEFFVCWTPIYVVNTWFAFDSDSLYSHLGPTEIALIQLLAYLSSCCNPITYCFMNKKFRNGFLSVFGCRKRCRKTLHRTNDQTGSFNDSPNYLDRRRSVRGPPRMNLLRLQETSI